MQLRGSVPPSPRVLHSRVCLAAGLPFFHYPVPVRPILWSSLGTPPCRPSTHALEQSAHCSQHRSQRGFWEQHSFPVTQHTGDSPARPCSDSGRAVLVARVAFYRSLHSGASPTYGSGLRAGISTAWGHRRLLSLHRRGSAPGSPPSAWTPAGHPWAFTSGPLRMVPPRPRSPLSAWPSPPHLRLRSLSSEPFSAEHPLVV